MFFQRRHRYQQTCEPCSTSPIIREMRGPPTPVRPAATRKAAGAGEDVGGGARVSCWWECELTKLLCKYYGRSSKRAKMQLP